MGHVQRDQMGFYPLWSAPYIRPFPLANDVRKHHLPIHFQDLVVLRLCFCNQLLVRDRDRDHGGYLSLAFWEGFGALL